MTDHHGHGGHGDHGGNGEKAGDGTEGVHGMLLFGADTLYLSHLPMFMRPHNYQVILEVGFDEAVRQALNAGFMHTFAPDEFPMSELDPGGDGPRRSSIPGTVWRGHFERKGTPIAEGVTAEVREVVHFAELDMKAGHETDRELRYLCFGRAGQLHLAHHVTASPDFDQVLTARLVPGTVTDPAGRPVAEDVTRDFGHAVPVEFRGRRDTPEDRLAVGETADGFFFATVGPGGSHGFGVQLAVDNEMYLELGELGS
jgi:hypothetical protein